MSVYTWGLNNCGQLGHNLHDKKLWEPKMVLELEGLNICKAAAGDGHTIAVTEGGDVYAWGRGKEGQLGLRDRMDHTTPIRVSTLEHETIVDVYCGALNSMAITANGRVYQWGMVHKPISQADAAGGAASGRLVGVARDPQRNERLQGVLKWSTDKWMMAEEEAESYYDELAAMGYSAEEAEEKAQGRNREYHGMLQMATRRISMPVPELISSLSQHKIVKVSAGYAHSLAVTDTGKLFACGYNDRGQLGLGHRINVADYLPVDTLANKFVVQVVCGHAHNLARVCSRDRGMASEELGCEVYVWGNGTLGQLGLGRKGTGKGRLFPTLLNTLPEQHQAQVIDIAAGGNFSVCVCEDGATYSFGHSEYYQHGGDRVVARDYVDTYYYYVPRLVSSLGEHKVQEVTCGSCFTMARTEEGDLMTWGWYTNGALGHGKGFYSLQPSKVRMLGGADRRVVGIAAGSEHSVAVTASRGHAYAATYRPLLDDPLHSDIQIHLEDSSRIFFVHAAVLAVRSQYFAGMIEAARSDPDAIVMVQLDHRNNDAADGDNTPEAVQTRKLLKLCMVGEGVNPITVQALLAFIYTDNLVVPAHKRVELYKLAKSIGLNGLAELSAKSLSRSGFARNVEIQDTNTEFKSTFVADIDQLVNGSLYSDVTFELPEHLRQLYATDKIYAHRCILARLEYFHTLFHGKFSESVRAHTNEDEPYVLSLEGFLADGIDPSLLLVVLRYLYTGDQSIIYDPETDLMSLLVAANRVGLWSLVQLCEKELSLHLTDFPENVHNCYEFAQRFNVPRLERQCQEILQSMGNANNESHSTTEETKTA